MDLHYSSTVSKPLGARMPLAAADTQAARGLLGCRMEGRGALFGPRLLRQAGGEVKPSLRAASATLCGAERSSFSRCVSLRQINLSRSGHKLFCRLSKKIISSKFQRLFSVPAHKDTLPKVTGVVISEFRPYFPSFSLCVNFSCCSGMPSVVRKTRQQLQS